MMNSESGKEYMFVVADPVFEGYVEGGIGFSGSRYPAISKFKIRVFTKY